ncbi:MAG: hypothetical protein M1168_02300 [Candidatus Marsarchaeota archaeon]|nr:hypothetical protein [Candidatus Marsarchaeota archaeon]
MKKIWQQLYKKQKIKKESALIKREKSSKPKRKIKKEEIKIQLKINSNFYKLN